MTQQRVKFKEIKKLIKEQKLNRIEVASQIGITPGTLKQVLAGNSQFGFETAVKLARLLNVSVYEIWTDI